MGLTIHANACSVQCACELRLSRSFQGSKARSSAKYRSSFCQLTKKASPTCAHSSFSLCYVLRCLVSVFDSCCTLRYSWQPLKFFPSNGHGVFQTQCLVSGPGYVVLLVSYSVHVTHNTHAMYLAPYEVDKTVSSVGVVAVVEWLASVAGAFVGLIPARAIFSTFLAFFYC